MSDMRNGKPLAMHHLSGEPGSAQLYALQPY